MTNTAIIEAVRRWQSHPFFPPLTCQADSAHGKLEAVELEGQVGLRCPKCPYLESVIPAAVLNEPLE